MKAWSVYQLADGVLTGSVLRGVGRMLELNVPLGCALIEGEFDPLMWRVIDGAAVPFETAPAPRSTEALWRDVRAKRDALFAATEWIRGRAADQGVEVPQAWRDYWQALRDITQQPDPAAIVWPARPE